MSEYIGLYMYEVLISIYVIGTSDNYMELLLLYNNADVWTYCAVVTRDSFLGVVVDKA